jgi:hypothetical protein
MPLVLSAVLVGLSGLIPLSATAAPSAAPVPYVLTKHLNLTTAGQMVYANGHLFISSGAAGSAVYVYSTAGMFVKKISAEPGAAGMVASADGSEVYVAQSAADAIGEINTTSLTAIDIPVDSCPTSLALAAGRLFYSWGCQYGQWNSQISSIDPTNIGTPVPALPEADQYNPPTLGGGGSTVVAISSGYTPADIVSYTAADTGVLTQTAATTADNYGPGEVAVSSDGSSVVIPGSQTSGLTDYNATSMHVAREFRSGASATAVALSPDGTHIVGGFGGSALVGLYTDANSTPVWQRVGVTSAPKTWADGANAQVLSGGITFSSDGSTIYALASVYGSTKVYLFASNLKTSKTSLSMSVKSSTANHAVSVSAKLSHPGTVVFKDRTAGKTYPIRDVTTNSKGEATLKFTTPFNGEVTAQFMGTTSLDPSQAVKSFKIQSTSRVTLSGAYATSGGVKLFHSRKDARFEVTVSPPVLDRSITVYLQYEHNGKWHSVGSLPLQLTKKGQARIRLGPTLSNTLTRIESIFRGDKLNPGSRAFSPTFKIA